MKSRVNYFSLLSFSLMIVLMIGCKKKPTACFDGPYFVEVGLPAVFDNCSENAKDYEWSFGDGTSSTTESASKTYTDKGTYSVTLQAESGKNSDETSRSIEVIICNAESFSSYFQYTKADLGSTTVDFSYSSGKLGMTYLWDFGDETTSAEQNPSHTYATAGSYTVTLTAYRGENCFRSRSETITAGSPAQLTIKSIVVQSTTEPLADGYLEGANPEVNIDGPEPEIGFRLGSCESWTAWDILTDVTTSSLPQTITSLDCKVLLLDGSTSFDYRISEMDAGDFNSLVGYINIYEAVVYSSGTIDLSEYISNNDYPSVISHTDGSFTFDLNVIWE